VQCIWFQTVFGYLIFSWLLCFLRWSKKVYY
jgi:hypothetical protein